MRSVTWHCNSSTRFSEMTGNKMGFNAINAVSRFQS